MEKMPRGLQLIIGYKLSKAAAEFLCGASIMVLGSVGFAQKLAATAQVLRQHATEAWSIALAERLLDASTAHHVSVVAMALGVDAIVTAIEGWALYRRYVWSRWLVVGTTASLLPFEILALLRHPNGGRIAVLVLNLLTVAYLVRRHEQPTASGVAA